MDVQASGGGDKTLRRIVALFVSLAVLAERAAGRSFPVRFLVLCFLRRAEIVATGYVLEGHGVPPSACVENAAAGNDPADALLLAARFRALAAALVLGWWSASQPVAREVTASESLLDPQPFSEAALAEARASSRPVFVWFTADWCVTCKVNEGVAIEREATRAAFEKAGVVSLRGDWTRRDEAIASFLADQGAAGVPLYLWYPPGSEARQLPQVLTPEALPDLARAAPPAP